MSKINQAKRQFTTTWIGKLLSNFSTEQEVQTVAASILWTVLETGTFQLAMILKMCGIADGDEVPETLQRTIFEVRNAVCKIRIPIEGVPTPLMVRDSNRKWVYNYDELQHWESDIVNQLADDFITIFPSSRPVEASDKQYIDGAWLLKHSKKAYKDQSARTAPLVFKAINILNSQGYRLNQDILNIQNLLPDQTKQLHETALHRLNRLRTLSAFNDEFFFKYTMDFRGRIYARSVIVTPQGDSFAKAVLNLSTAKPLGQDGLTALAIHYANQSNHDKDSYSDRLKWARTEGFALATKLYNANSNWLIIGSLLTEQDNFEQYAAAMEWYRAITSHDPQAYESSLVCHQDATNSGFQFGAALLQDRVTAKLVNITGGLTKDDIPADLYKVMAFNVIRRIESTHPHWVQHVHRKFCKTPIMVTGYGAGKKVVEQDVIAYMEEKNILLDFEEIKEQFFMALDETVGSMVLLTKCMKDHAKTIIKDRDEDVVFWTTNDGLKVFHHYRDNEGRKVRIGSKIGLMRAKREGETDPLAEKMLSALPPNFIHSIDGSMLREAARQAYQHNVAFSPIHDSFGTHAADYWKLHKILKQAFVNTMSHDWYQEFCKANSLRPTLEMMGDYDFNEATNSAYMFS